MTTRNAAAPTRPGWVRAPNDLLAGLLLLALGAAALWFGRDLSVGTAFHMGPGHVPRLLGWAVAGFGAVLLLRGLLWRGPPLARWPLRPILLVPAAMLVFALSIERAGLLLASLLAVLLAALASPQNRPHGALLLAACLAAAASVLFVLLLQLPLRVWPRWAV